MHLRQHTRSKSKGRLSVFLPEELAFTLFEVQQMLTSNWQSGIVSANGLGNMRGFLILLLLTK